MQRNRRCRASGVARENVRCDGPGEAWTPGDEQQPQSSIDRKSFRRDMEAAWAAPSFSDCESTNAALQPRLDTPDNDPGVHRLLLEPAVTRSRRYITKAFVWF